MTNDVFEILELSTAHVSQAAAEWFDNAKPTGPGAKRPYMRNPFGWMFTVPDSDEMDFVEMVGCGGFTAAIKLAQELKCSYLLFDNVYNVNESLPTFDW